MKDWKARLPRDLPSKGNAHFVFAIKTETGYRTELTGTASANELVQAMQQMMEIEKHKPGEPLLYPDE